MKNYKEEIEKILEKVKDFSDGYDDDMAANNCPTPDDMLVDELSTLISTAEREAYQEGYKKGKEEVREKGM